MARINMRANAQGVTFVGKGAIQAAKHNGLMMSTLNTKKVEIAKEEVTMYTESKLDKMAFANIELDFVTVQQYYYRRGEQMFPLPIVKGNYLMESVTNAGNKFLIKTDKPAAELRNEMIELYETGSFRGHRASKTAIYMFIAFGFPTFLGKQELALETKTIYGTAPALEVLDRAGFRDLSFEESVEAIKSNREDVVISSIAHGTVVVNSNPEYREAVNKIHRRSGAKFSLIGTWGAEIDPTTTKEIYVVLKSFALNNSNNAQGNALHITRKNKYTKAEKLHAVVKYEFKGIGEAEVATRLKLATAVEYSKRAYLQVNGEIKDDVYLLSANEIKGTELDSNAKLQIALEDMSVKSEQGFFSGEEVTVYTLKVIADKYTSAETYIDELNIKLRANKSYMTLSAVAAMQGLEGEYEKYANYSAIKSYSKMALMDLTKVTMSESIVGSGTVKKVVTNIVPDTNGKLIQLNKNDVKFDALVGEATKYSTELLMAAIEGKTNYLPLVFVYMLSQIRNFSEHTGFIKEAHLTTNYINEAFAQVLQSKLNDVIELNGDESYIMSRMMQWKQIIADREVLHFVDYAEIPTSTKDIVVLSTEMDRFNLYNAINVAKARLNVATINDNTKSEIVEQRLHALEFEFNKIKKEAKDKLAKGVHAFMTGANKIYAPVQAGLNVSTKGIMLPIEYKGKTFTLPNGEERVIEVGTKGTFERDPVLTKLPVLKIEGFSLDGTIRVNPIHALDTQMDFDGDFGKFFPISKNRGKVEDTKDFAHADDFNKVMAEFLSSSNPTPKALTEEDFIEDAIENFVGKTFTKEFTGQLGDIIRWVYFLSLGLGLSLTKEDIDSLHKVEQIGVQGKNIFKAGPVFENPMVVEALAILDELGYEGFGERFEEFFNQFKATKSDKKSVIDLI